MNVLILDDDYRVAMIHEAYVKRYIPHATCEVFYQVEAFLHHVQQSERTYDLLLLDLFLPHTHGFHMIQQLRETHPETDIIVITAANDQASILEAKRWGVLDYMTKPVSEERLKESFQWFVEWKAKVKHKQQWTQSFIDEIFHFNVQSTREAASLPKGIQEETLAIILKNIETQKTPQTASEVAASVDLSRSTVRRYLEYLVEEERLAVDLDYQSIGRPRRVYVMREQKEQKGK